MSSPSDAELADWIWRRLAAAPPTAHWLLGLAYRAGLIDGRYQTAVDLEQAGREAARNSRAILKQPRHAQLQARRGEPADQMRRNLTQPARRPATGRPVSTRTGDDRL